MMGKIGKIIGGIGSLIGAIALLLLSQSARDPETAEEDVHEKDSDEWIRRLSDQDWETEREKIRKKFCDPDYDIQTRDNFKGVLDRFDKIKSERDWKGEKPTPPSYSREHGHNLYKPD